MIIDLEQPGVPSVEVQVSLEQVGDLLSVVEANSVISAVDKVQHKLEQQLRKHKQKRTRIIAHQHWDRWLGPVRQMNNLIDSL